MFTSNPNGDLPNPNSQQKTSKANKEKPIVIPKCCVIFFLQP